ncbi:MAG: ADP-forming succinate--CoA ligase subunit beta [Candidatus Omnitrophica bacterium CG11_big_fil_rev_8_21_14_0_20_45_26]|uniref:Succinate--CoA ligase [ADP-forming] subunit beta n=1 Tax=Candidatus Abzuiibacterium crystallinum TaxID=1974748 RepID=A0A2H0LTA9_9BACT|nr:MAG: ADP-forming succinate--CoA ligase subunit beta [Candidatus Omnitrophica bacterium CG11_big_fil_rev_8_21_14_0_20_45_26]PIW65597.1 MAG: ADP-forming succinate--CoA ligase subunit beta [Candidatus Omnitrophica bacterium CG12_big_fil_rev_8_21_14_0_65_45_16]
MKVHEYQAKTIFAKEGLPVPKGRVFRKEDLSVQGIQTVASSDYVVKAQVHAGGRGKAGGVKLVKTADEAFAFAKSLLGRTLVTFQSGSGGQPINQVLVEPASHLAKELYLGIALDREASLPCVIFSDAGGMEIEEIAHKEPEKILKKHFKPAAPLSVNDAKDFIKNFPFQASTRTQIAEIISKLTAIYVKYDISLVEINPLGVLDNGEVRIVDAKIVFDDNGLFRHPELAEMRDVAQEDLREVEAKKYELSYVGLEGSIGCMVNGAGLAMATMDIIKLHGGEPANFLDVGGGASLEKVKAAFTIILQDSNVKAILVNIFGGIMKCDVIAEGIVAAVKEVNLKVPLVVRLEGTNVEQGKKILAESKLKLQKANDLADAAKKVVQAAAG